VIEVQRVLSTAGKEGDNSRDSKVRNRLEQKQRKE
jgi:hypothetical protein